MFPALDTICLEQGRPVYYRPIFTDCGEMCCRRRSLACITSTGELYISNQQFTQFGDCDDSPSPPGQHYYPLGDCHNECGEQ